jgi:FkbM family methyltransferase
LRLSISLYQAVEAVVGRAWTWRIGRWLYLGSRREMANDPVVNGEYTLQRAWVKANLARDRPEAGLQVFDVGANVGAWTANLIGELTRSGVDGYCIRAFEPAPAQRISLTALCRDGIDAGKVLVDPRGVAAEPGKARFHVTGDVGGTSALASQGDKSISPDLVEIDVVTLDAVCAEQGVSRLDLVKVDTEGNDFNVILGAKGLFDREAIEVLQFEYNSRWVAFGRSLLNVFDFMEGRPYLIGRLTQTGIEVYGAWHPELERYAETNYVIAHHDALAALPHWRAEFDAANTAVVQR